MSSCLSGGGRAYGFDLDIVKSSSPSPSTRSSHSSSPSSTLSESSNSPLAISTKRARTPRKRPDQTFKEAAALLSTIYPNIFSAKSLRKICRHARPYDSFSEPSVLLPPFPALGDAGFLLHQRVPEKPNLRIEPKPATSYGKACLSPPSTDFRGFDSPGLEEDFDAESILDEEIGEGIDSIMGSLSVNNNNNVDFPHYSAQINPYLGNPMGYGFGGGFEFGLGFGHGGSMRRALKRADNEDWWQSPTVEVHSIAPKLKASSSSSPSSDKKKRKKKVEKVVKLMKKAGSCTPTTTTTMQEQGNPNSGLSLKLNYDEVLRAWSDRGSPFSGATDSSESTPVAADTIEARLAQIDLFPEMTGSVREASVTRYKEKRRTRFFSKKIRYQVRKGNADTRPRMKGRFVRKPSLIH